MQLSRRKLMGASIAAICTAVPSLANAWFPHGATSTSFNGGKSQVNLDFLQIAGDYAFLNCLKTAQSWSFINNASAPVTADLLDANGYPATIINSGVFTTFYVPTQAARPGNYVITWDGTGTIFCGMSNTLVSGSKTSSGGAGAGRYVFSTTDFRFSVGISSIGSPGITNMKVFWLGVGATSGGDEALYNSGQIFGTLFKQRLQALGVGVIRFLNWQIANNTNVTTWATRKPQSYVYYNSYESRASIYAGVTTNSGNDYSASAPSGWAGLVDKATVTVVFNASATQSGLCTLNVGGTGAINIINEFCNPLSVGSNSYPIGGTFQSMATLVYDAVLNAWMKQGGDVALGSIGLNNCVPPELMFQLCKEVGAHPHFVAPFLAVTPMSDYMTSLAQYAKAYTSANAPWMVPRYEGPNELWNGSSGVNNTQYAIAVANAYHTTDPTHWTTTGDYQNWYGKVMSTIGQAINAVYGGTVSTQTAYQVLCGVQTGTGNTFPSGTNASNPRLSSLAYTTQTASPQAGYTASAASGWVTHVCCAQYNTQSDYGTGTETTLAANFAGKAFVASIAAGVMNVTAINASAGAAFAVGDTIFGTEIFAVGGPIPSGVTITSFTTATTPQTITAITNANPAVVSVASPPANGTKVQITGAAAGGMTGLADGWYTVAGATGSTYQLQGVNSTTFGTYVSGAASQSAGNFNVSNSSITVASQNMTAATDLTAPNTYADTVNSGSGSFTLSNCAILYANWKSWAQSFGIQKMCGYEGGYSPDYTSNGNSLVDMLRSASKLDPNLGPAGTNFTAINYNNFVGLTGGGFVAEFPACFQFSGNPNIHGYSSDAWSVAEDIYQTPNSPQWQAIAAFNQ